MGCTCGAPDSMKAGLYGTKAGLRDAVQRVQSRTRLAVSGRYHRAPKRIEDDYAVEGHILGTGYNGAVVRARSRRTNQAFAVKSFNLGCTSRAKAAQIRAEAEVYLAMDHPHVARLVDVYESAAKLHFVMECMLGGELFDRVTKLQRFSERGAAHAVSQMLLAVSYLHSHGIVHRDLKLQNFLYEADDSDHLKLIDFGFSEIVEPNTRIKGLVGTLAYMAPEVICAKGGYTSQCDLWSLGVITFILLVGYMPFHGPDREQIRMIRNGEWKAKAYGKKLVRWERLSGVAKDFVSKLLTVDPTVRLTAPQALGHPFLAEGQSPKKVCDVDIGIVEALSSFAKASEFRRACMEVMAWSLTSGEQAQVRDAFEQMDANCQGTITLEELRSALVGRGQVTDELIEPIFKALDAEKTDVIHYSEFLAAMLSTRIAMHDDLLAATFRRFDTDNSGYISLDNLREVIGDSFDGVPVEELLREADFKKDNRISYEEFIQYLQGDQAQPAVRNAANRLIDAKIKEGDLCMLRLQDFHCAQHGQGFDRTHTEGSSGQAVHHVDFVKQLSERSRARATQAPGSVLMGCSPASASRTSSNPRLPRGLSSPMSLLQWWGELALAFGPCGCGPAALAAGLGAGKPAGRFVK